MEKIFIPANQPEDWKPLLAEPEKHWRSGYSAKALAYCWQKANDFPECVRQVFNDSNIRLFRDIELLLAFPEYKIPLPGGSRPSQSDIFVLAKGDKQLISIMVEGKAAESFGPTIAEWGNKSSVGKNERLHYLVGILNLNKASLDTIRYQLIHRTASAIIEAQKFNAGNAVMLVHSFGDSDEQFDDYKNFLGLYGLNGKADSVAGPARIKDIDLYFAWVRYPEGLWV